MKEILTYEDKIEIIQEPVTYRVKGKVFIVEPVFMSDGKETIVDVLMRLMKSDIVEE